MSHFQPHTMRARYLEALLLRHRTLPLQFSSASYTLPLPLVFQPLKLYQHPLPKKNPHEQTEKSPAPTEAEVKMALNGADALRQSLHRRMVILGDPGMGKTTLLKDLLCQAIEQALTDPAAALPLFLSLPDLARSGETLPGYLGHLLMALEMEPDFTPVLADELAQGRAFLCLDGLDEVLPALRPETIALINREALRLGGTWVIGSRFTEYQGGHFASGRFDEWELQPLDETNQVRLVASLLPAFLSSNQPGEATEAGELHDPDLEASRLVRALRQDEGTTTWGQSPLLLSLVTAAYAMTGVLPSSRVVLYKEIIDALLAMRQGDEKQRGELRLLLADIALALYQNRGRAFTVQDVLAWLSTAYPSEDAAQHYARVANILASGLLENVADQTYCFKHQMLQEYLAALSLARQLCSAEEDQRQATRAFLWRKYTYSRWNEVLRFMVGILVQEYGAQGRPAAGEWLRALAAIRQQPDGDVGHLGLILALRSLPEMALEESQAELIILASELIVAWAETVVATARAIDDPWEGLGPLQRLQRLARDVRVLRKEVVAAGIEHLASVFLDAGESTEICYYLGKTLSELGRYIPIQAFFTYLRERPSSYHLSADKMLARAAEQIPLEPLLEVAVDPAEHWRARELAVFLLGQSGKPEAVEALVKVAREDTHATCDAIDALAALPGKYVPFDVLLDIFLHDTGWSGWKQIHAARALGKLGDERAIEPLAGALLAGRDHGLDEIVEALFTLQAPFAFEQLLLWLSSEDMSLQKLALEKLLLQSQPVPAEPLLAIMLMPAANDFSQRDYYKASQLRYSALRLLNRQAFLLSPSDLLQLLGTVSYIFPKEEVTRAFLLQDNAQSLDVLFKALVDNENHYTAFHAQETLTALQQEIPVELLLARYAHDGTGVGSQEADWGRALLKYGTRLPAETLVTIACECTHHIEDYNDEDLVEALGKLGAYTVEAVLDKLPVFGLLDDGLLTRVIRAIYEHIPEDRLVAALRTSAGDLYLATGILALTGDKQYLPVLLPLLEQQKADPAGYGLMLSALAKFRGLFPLDLLFAVLQCRLWSVSEVGLDILHELEEDLNLSQLAELLVPWLYTLTAWRNEHKEEDDSQCLVYIRVAIDALSACKHFAPVEFIISFVEDQNLRDDVVEALVRLAPFVPFEVFLSLLDQNDDELRNYAITGLSKQRERVELDKLLTLFLFHSEKWEEEQQKRMKEEEEEEREGEENEENEEDLDEKEVPVDHRGIALSVLRTFIELEETASVERIKKNLEHEDEKVRAGASRVLRALETTRPEEYIVARAGDRWQAADRFMGPAVLKAQAALGEQASFEFWLAELDGDSGSSEEMATQVLEALAEVVPTSIIELARERDRPGTRKARLRAWATLGQVDELIDAARFDKHVGVRLTAVGVLSGLANPATAEPLAALLREEDNRNFVSEAASALGKLGSAAPLEPLLEACGYRDEEWTTNAYFEWEPALEAAEALKRTHPVAFQSLVPLAEAIVRGEQPSGVFDARVQSRVASAIGAIGRAEPRLVTILTDLLAHPYWQVRLKAAEACGKIRRNLPNATIQRLLTLRHDPQSRAIRHAADEALAQILSLENSWEDA